MNIASKFFSNKSLTFPYIQINGKITRQTTIFVEGMLKKIPSSTSKLAIVVNSSGGSLAQAHIINTKLNLLSSAKRIQLYTFIEDTAVNAGFLLASNGHKIFADNTSIIGGLEVSERKLILGEMIDRVTYKNESSISSQMNHFKEIDPAKKSEVERVFNVFSQQAGSAIRKARSTSEGVDLTNLFTAKEARENGLIDGIGRINQLVPQQFAQYKLKRMEETPFERIRTDLRKLNVW